MDRNEIAGDKIGNISCIFLISTLFTTGRGIWSYEPEKSTINPHPSTGPRIGRFKNLAANFYLCETIV